MSNMVVLDDFIFVKERGRFPSKFNFIHYENFESSLVLEKVEFVEEYSTYIIKIKIPGEHKSSYPYWIMFNSLEIKKNLRFNDYLYEKFIHVDRKYVILYSKKVFDVKDNIMEKIENNFNHSIKENKHMYLYKFGWIE